MHDALERRCAGLRVRPWEELASPPLHAKPRYPGRCPRRGTHPALPAGTGQPAAVAETPWAWPPPASASASSAPVGEAVYPPCLPLREEGLGRADVGRGGTGEQAA